MNSPFEQCAVLNVTGARTGRFRSDQPNKANTPKSADPFVLSQLRRSRLVMVVDRIGYPHCFTGMTVAQINDYLENVLGLDVRVDADGVAYVQEKDDAGEA